MYIVKNRLFHILQSNNFQQRTSFPVMRNDIVRNISRVSTAFIISEVSIMPPITILQRYRNSHKLDFVPREERGNRALETIRSQRYQDKNNKSISPRIIANIVVRRNAKIYWRPRVEPQRHPFELGSCLLVRFGILP